MTRKALMNEASVGAAIVAIVQAIKFALPDKVSGIVTIAVAAVLGLIAGLLELAGLDWVTGLAVGLAAVGVITAASKVAGK